ncbi:MAG: hypothetical protein KGJ23_07860 [Euryarchaeota archaeon]|nr:hypothetical protein [Euryarchaeota archaeon]MDE1836515.1 hypothetical protein [Euryarchaeota archaeon]MDE1879290.1 hypothetical protein [Euryarchaeota archaeon]MDE2044485.1 hypothetical protein [Thermoplasmata archaeon]
MTALQWFDKGTGKRLHCANGCAIPPRSRLAWDPSRQVWLCKLHGEALEAGAKLAAAPVQTRLVAPPPPQAAPATGLAEVTSRDVRPAAANCQPEDGRAVQMVIHLSESDDVVTTIRRSEFGRIEEHATSHVKPGETLVSALERTGEAVWAAYRKEKARPGA